MSSWEKDFFRAAIFTPAMEEAAGPAAREALFLWKALDLKKGSRVLDVACGTGRHAIPLARRGVFVTGVDSTQSYLAQARRDAGNLWTLSLKKADMRRLPFTEAFDAAYNVWTSFGYFEKPSDDLRALRSMARALKPGGKLLLDIVDFAWQVRRFEPLQCEEQVDGAWRVERNRLRLGKDPAILSEWTLLRRGQKPQKANLFVRGYDEKRLSAAMRRVGLTPLKRWRGLDGSSVGPRLVVLAQRGGQSAMLRHDR